jgi:branched-chain amino acid transport system substrate-binding protein
MKKFLLLLTLVCLTALPVHADILIGYAGPLTGQNATFGDSLRHGAEQAVADINAQGGVNGEKLVLREVDDACDPKQAVAVANQLASAGIKFVIGHFCSACSIPASKVYMEEGMLMISPGSSNPRLTDEGKDLVFRTYGRDDKEGGFLGTYLAKHLADKKIAIVQDNSAYGLGMAQEVQKALHAGSVKEILFETYTPGQRDYSALISKLKSAGAQVVVVGGYHTEVGLIARQIKEQKADIQIVGGNSLATDELWSIAGPAAEGLLMSYTSDPMKHPEAKPAIENLKKAGFSPSGYTLYGYAAGQAMAEGIRRAGKTDPMKVAAALRAIPVNTVFGPISFDAKGDVVGITYAVYKWHDGKYAEVGE